jgi:hypothetical protein
LFVRRLLAALVLAGVIALAGALGYVVGHPGCPAPGDSWRIVAVQLGLLPELPAERAPRQRSLQSDEPHWLPAGE